MELTHRLLLVGKLIAVWSILQFTATYCQFSAEPMAGYGHATKAPPPNNSTNTNEQYTFNYLPTGQWRKHHDNDTKRATSIAPFCCANNERIPHSNNDTIYDHNVENNITSCSTTDHSLRHMGNWGCDCRMHDDPYVWDNLPSWDATDFCRKLGVRKVLLLGDSTMHQAREFELDWSIFSIYLHSLCVMLAKN